MSDQITGYSVAGVIEADPNNEFVWVKFVDCSAAVAAARQERLRELHQQPCKHFDDGVKAAREAVAALMSPPSDKDPTPLDFAIYEEVLPAIDAKLKEKP